MNAAPQPTEDPTRDRAEPSIVPSVEGLAEIEAELRSSDESGDVAKQRAVEARMIELLREDDFTGPRFERLYKKKMAPRMVGYAYPIISSWVDTGHIFHQCLKFRRPIIKQARNASGLWTPDERDHFVMDAMLGNHELQGGVDFFAEYGLRKGHWDPAKGASAMTYFVGSCVCCFAKIYNEWWKKKVLREKLLQSTTEGFEEPDPLLNTPDPQLGPAELATVRDEAFHALARVKDPQVREVLRLRSLGYTQAEGAAEVGLTAKAVERRLHTFRKSLRGQDRPEEHNHDDKGRS